MVDTTVKYFNSTMPGAPVLSGTVGAMITLLDACLKDGWGLVTLDGISVTAGVATATRAAGISFVVDQVVTVAGATPAGLNGDKRVISVTSTTYTFDATGVTAGAATGTITSKVAPAGWTKSFTGTNLAAYKSSDVTATGMYLRVDDTVAKTVRVVGYETMSDVNTGTGPFPTVAQQSGGLWWSKSDAASGASRPWQLFSNGKIMYLALAYSSSVVGAHQTSSTFGDINTLKTSDAYNCIITGNAADQSGSSPGSIPNLTTAAINGAASSEYVARAYTQIGSAIAMSRYADSIYLGNGGWASAVAFAGAVPYPNGSDGGLYVVPVKVCTNGTVDFRGYMPGLYMIPQVVPAGTFATNSIVTGVTGLTGKRLAASSNGAAIPLVNTILFDVTGPW